MSKVSQKINEAKTWWETTSGWFKDSATILVARLTAVAGIVTTAVGTFDWSPLWNLFTTGTSFTKQQLIMMGVGIIGLGITTEIARRRSL